MNKRTVNFERFKTACGSVRTPGAFIDDNNLRHQIHECYDILSEIAEAEEAKANAKTNANAYDYLYADDIATLLHIGRSKAYELIAETNQKLAAAGKYVISGRVPRKLFMEQLY